MITIMIVHDQPPVRRRLRHLVEYSPDLSIIAEATSGQGAVIIATCRPADVVLLELPMADENGITATRMLAAPPMRLRVLVTTAYDIDDYLFGAIDAGALGFLLTPATPDTYIAAIRAVASGNGMLSPEVTPRVLAAAAHTRHPAPALTHHIRLLTAREVHIVYLLADDPCSTKTIAKRLHVEPATVKGHLKRIMAKLGVNSRAQLVTWAFRNGVVS